MCRLVAYLGRPILLDHVLVKPSNSIVMQSLHARETDLRTNGDGFGLGWYTPEISPDPGLFTSIAPAWNDRNLLYLTAKIKAPCFFAHVRSASAGGVTTYNCHPFIHHNWMLMHNGEISQFIFVKRHLRHLLDDDIYHWIKGDTDSEHLFALFLQLAKGRDLSDLQIVADVMEQTIQSIEILVKKYGQPGSSYFNICLSDGKRMLATRYCTNPKKKALTLHYLSGYKQNHDGSWVKAKEAEDYVLISSERLNDLPEAWVDVPLQSMLLVDEDKSISVRTL